MPFLQLWKTFAASKIFTNAPQGCNCKPLMASMVDITLFVSSFSIYVILLNLNVLLALRIGLKFKSILTTTQYVLALLWTWWAASKYHLAYIELEQVPKNWSCTSCTTVVRESGTGRRWWWCKLSREFPYIEMCLITWVGPLLRLIIIKMTLGQFYFTSIPLPKSAVFSPLQ